MINVVFFNYDLKKGGAEQVIVSLANQLCMRNYNVIILTISDDNEFETLINNNVKIISFGVTKIRDSIRPLVNFFRKNDFDLFFANVWPLTSLASLISLVTFRRKKTIIVEHCNIFFEYENRNIFFRVSQKILVSITHLIPRKIITVSDGIGNSLKKINPFLSTKLQTIYNPVPTKIKLTSSKDFDLDNLIGFKGKKILAVGNLKKQKDYPNLIYALNEFNKENSNFICMIVGDGDEKNNLLQLVRTCGLENNIFLVGSKNNPEEFMKYSDILVLSSIAEGFGLVLVEAMQNGLTPVSTDCPSGPSEIIKNEYGYLCRRKNPFDLLEAIKKGLKSPISPDLLLQRAEYFSVSNSLKNYEDLIRNVII